MIYLASQSPRRKALLQQLGVTFEQFSADIDETPEDAELPANYVSRMATEKAQKGWLLLPETDAAIVIAADTSVIHNQQILGKPANQQEFNQMLHALSDNSHEVLTAVSLKTPEQQKTVLVSSQVTFCELTQQQIDWYWQTQEPLDKAGGYAIQGLAAQFITHMQGSYSAVVGLPLFETAQLLQWAKVELYER
ncbi:Maf family protein [Neptunicella marina]|uniref:dTTP/UTP pyrophosphatase n=1 Tax=Neptunicella marina TaxID=2125989 RepID=A0A8J6IV10_9ALTE|nr:Maf family protein [Neptunicella marina]MBC3766121.1 septum formation inhibitor Maf [Neptunicella marina]